MLCTVPASCSDVVIPALATRPGCKRRGLVISRVSQPKPGNGKAKSEAAGKQRQPGADGLDGLHGAGVSVGGPMPHLSTPQKAETLVPARCTKTLGSPERIGIRTPQTDLGWTGQIYGTDNSKPAQADTFNPFAATFTSVPRGSRTSRRSEGFQRLNGRLTAPDQVSFAELSHRDTWAIFSRRQVASPSGATHHLPLEAVTHCAPSDTGDVSARAERD
jgi:hypothetical protein